MKPILTLLACLLAGCATSSSPKILTPLDSGHEITLKVGQVVGQSQSRVLPCSANACIPSARAGTCNKKGAPCGAPLCLTKQINYLGKLYHGKATVLVPFCNKVCRPETVGACTLPSDICALPVFLCRSEVDQAMNLPPPFT